MIGTTLSHYRIIAKLGEGGMGVVYRAEDTTLGREVAIKVLSEEMSSNPERLSRLQREAKVLASINHPNIASIYSFETVDPPEEGGHVTSTSTPLSPSSVVSPISFLSMELVEGETLADQIPQGGVTPKRFFEIALPLTSAIAAAHDKGIVHRDLKPANIMITSTGQVKVLDFGLAKLVQLEDAAVGATDSPTATLPTETGVIMGTLGYMSPEQVRGEEVDRRSDVFSIGLVLHELLTGQRAFAAPSAPDVMSAILRDTPRPVDELRSDLPHHLGRIISRCLEKESDRRFQSATDVHIELENLAREIDTDSILASHSVAEPEAAPTRPSSRNSKQILVAFLGILAVAFAYWRLVPDRKVSPLPASGATIQSLAVLPFDNLMNDPDQDYFVEGMQEALITDLSKLSGLRVISRTSAMRYKETDKALPQIATELNVDALIEGSVLRADGQVRITAQLIDGRTDEHLWADSYDKEHTDVLALLSEVARAIATEIEITLTPEEHRRLSEIRSVDPAAYEAFLKGRYFFTRFTGEGLRKAIESYEEAIALQPDYAEAYSGLAGCHLLLGGFGYEDLDQEAALAREYTLDALALDENLAEAHALLGWTRLYFDWDWPGAAEAFERALELNPFDPYACHGYGDYLTVMGRAEDGLDQIKKATEVDPLAPLINAPVAAHAMIARRYDEAIAKATELLELDPNYPVAHSVLAEAYWHKGDLEKALTLFRAGWQNRPAQLEAADRGYAESGPKGALREVAKVLAPLAESGRVGPKYVASLFALAGDADPAIYWLEKAYEQRVPQLMLIKLEPTWDAVRDDPRFNDLTRRIGIP